MRPSDLSDATWRKSSHSNDGVNGACIEVAVVAERIELRDSKELAGPVLAFSRSEWRAFVGGVRTGQFGQGDRH